MRAPIPTRQQISARRLRARAWPKWASNGVTFLDGNLVVGAGITTAILGFDDAGKDVLNLYTAEKNVLACRPRG